MRRWRRGPRRRRRVEADAPMNVRVLQQRRPPWLTPRCAAGLAVVTLGAWLLASDAWRWIAADARIAGALAGGLVAAAATALGTLPLWFSQRVSQRTADAMLGFGAGVML